MSSHVEQIKQRLSVVDVVGSYIKLQKAGANFKAPCPFHSEKAPSFYVSPPREIWHCFGCNRGGDLFEFVKQIEGVEFPEALRILADRAGVNIVFRKQDTQFQSEKTRLLDLLKDATYFYQKQIIENKEVLDYLRKRGLKNETLKKFNIGYAPEEEKGWRCLVSYLKSKGYTGSEIEKTGLAIKKDVDYYDRFRGRIMFPLKDVSGRIVGFSGRIFGSEKEGVGKYINTPQTILYDKSKILYGFDLGKIEIRKQDACVLVEGQMDVLMSHQAGVENTVAVSGTALTEQHLGIIKRLTNNLVMSFDSDDAGLEAAKRSIDLALQNGLEVQSVPIFEGKDPADVILENPEQWSKIVSSATHVIDFYLNNFEEKYKNDSRRFKMETEKKVLPYVLMLQSEIDKSHWISEIAKRIRVKEGSVLEELKKLSLNKTRETVGERVELPKNRCQLLKERLAGVALWKKDKKLISEFVKSEMAGILRKKDKDYLNKLSFESELYYTGIKDLDAEIRLLSQELKKEIVKEKLEKLAEEVCLLEVAGKKKELEKKLGDFQKLSKELSSC
ncbi:DNA primase [Patescibacteria group bacterium]